MVVNAQEQQPGRMRKELGQLNFALRVPFSCDCTEIGFLPYCLSFFVDSGLNNNWTYRVIDILLRNVF